MPSHNTYHLFWVSLTLVVGYLFTAAPGKRSHCSLPWMRGIPSPLALLTLSLELLLLALLRPREYNMQNARLDKAPAEINVAGRTI